MTLMQISKIEKDAQEDYAKVRQMHKIRWLCLLQWWMAYFVTQMILRQEFIILNGIMSK